MFKLIFALMFIIVGFARREALPCGNLDCSAPNATEKCPSKRDCKYGTTSSFFCSCCPVCAKGLGESCGTLDGACANDLQCCISRTLPILFMAAPEEVGKCYSNLKSCPPSTTPSTK